MFVHYSTLPLDLTYIQPIIYFYQNKRINKIMYKTIIVGTSETIACAYSALKHHGVVNTKLTAFREDASATEVSLQQELMDSAAPASKVVATDVPVLEGRKRGYRRVFLYGLSACQKSA